MKGAPRARALEAVVLTRDVQGFEQCVLYWYHRNLAWERFRTIGRLPLFTISYAALILIPIVFSVVAVYNSGLDTIRTNTDQIPLILTALQQHVHSFYDPIRQTFPAMPPIEIFLQQDFLHPTHPIHHRMATLCQHLEPWHTSLSHLSILLSTVLLAVASTPLYVVLPTTHQRI
jgi:hypothetical protein